MTMTMTWDIVAILRGVLPGEAAGIASALVDAGIDEIEVPMNSPDAPESIRRMIAACPSARIGAGTVLSTTDVDLVAEAGAVFVVSPDANPDVIARSKALGLASAPGVFTATEAFAAIRAGADALKIFPASIMGPSGVAALKAVLPPDLPVLAVGGVDADNMADWRMAGCSGFGIGSTLYKPGRSAADVSAAAQHLMATWRAISS